MVVEFFLGQLLHRQPMQEGDRCKHVSVRLDFDTPRREVFLKQPPHRQRGKRPIPAIAAYFMGKLANTRKGRQQNPAWLQDAVKRLNGRASIVDKLKYLSEDDAIEGVRRHVVGTGQVGDNGRLPVVFCHVEDVAYIDAAASIPLSIGGVLDF